MTIKSIRTKYSISIKKSSGEKRCFSLSNHFNRQNQLLQYIRCYHRRYYILQHIRICYKTTIFTTSPQSSENTITYAMYRINRLTPRTIFSAPRLEIFVAGPVIINVDALPMLMPSIRHGVNLFLSFCNPSRNYHLTKDVVITKYGKSAAKII